MKMSSQYRESAVGIRDYSYYSSPAFSVPVSSVQSNRLKPSLRSTVSVAMALRRRRVMFASTSSHAISNRTWTPITGQR